MNKRPILSICIPTYERPKLLFNTIDSIISQNVNIELYEICVSDNSKSDVTEEIIQQFTQPNIKYKHIRPVGSYLNLVRALEMGTGKYLKLINDYTKIRDGELQNIINEVERQIHSKALIAWSNGSTKEYRGKSFDQFIRTLGINTTWSICFGIYKDDFDELSHLSSLNEMFPHVSMLFAEYKNKSEFIINNSKIFENQEILKSAEYNLPDVFGRQYITMLKELYITGSISRKTFNMHKIKMLFFISDWKVRCLNDPKRYTFSFVNDKKTLCLMYGNLSIILYYAIYYVYRKKIRIKRMIKREKCK